LLNYFCQAIFPPGKKADKEILTGVVQALKSTANVAVPLFSLLINFCPLQHVIQIDLLISLLLESARHKAHLVKTSHEEARCKYADFFLPYKCTTQETRGVAPNHAK
jgi:hypothetical protein